MSSHAPATGATTAPTTPARVRHEHEHGHHHHKSVRREMMSAAADALGMDRKELRTALRSGQTLAQIAEGAGVSVDTLKTKMSGAVTAAASPERAEKIVAKLDDIIAGNRVDFGNHYGHRNHHGAGQVGEALKTFADSLGMTPQAVVDALKSGTSIRDLVAQLPAGTTPAPAPTQPGELVDTAA